MCNPNETSRSPNKPSQQVNELLATYFNYINEKAVHESNQVVATYAIQFQEGSLSNQHWWKASEEGISEPESRVLPFFCNIQIQPPTDAAAAANQED